MEASGVGRSHGCPGDGIGHGVSSNASRLYQRSGSCGCFRPHQHRSEEWSRPRMRDPRTQCGWHCENEPLASRNTCKTLKHNISISHATRAGSRNVPIEQSAEETVLISLSCRRLPRPPAVERRGTEQKGVQWGWRTGLLRQACRLCPRPTHRSRSLSKSQLS